MPRFLLALALLLALPAPAFAAAGDPDTDFGRRGTVTLKATDADAVGFAVKVISGNRVLAGGSAAGQLVVLKLRASGSLDSTFGTRGQVVPALPGTSLDGVKGIETVRDGRVVASGTLRLADGSTRFVTLRLLPSGEIDPSYGAGQGYVLSGPNDAVLHAMTMNRDGVVYLGGESNGAPFIMRLLGDGTVDPAFANPALGLTGRVTGLLIRPDGTLTYTVATGAAAFTVVRLNAAGTLDPAWGGTGVVTHVLSSGTGPDVGAMAVRQGSATTTLVAGTDTTAAGTARGAVVRLNADGSLDTAFGSDGITRISRSGRDLHVTSMVRDRSGRILVAGTGRTPDSLLVRLRANGARDARFGNGGLTFPVLGAPPGGTPVFTRLDAIDVAGSKAVVVGSAAGPGRLVRSINGTTYTGRFALTVTRFD
ncbi:delta-60 repeat domain-containing protein [Solirubrobacter sp. CPCC 204708]|uniref:Delta-60 repeat domain-containing protein n=1 Tax=Solirubrobacter deserti TaxID=2282478 RepID=A0ABT4RKI9_9ACTN|nr:delta-60 repeat domain-containing protein [Solirubrobacter deserti]MBE2317339.1 delta-60 repeat domain-containing protein [Solirubrobacter deserti]MDA0139068.1 delta-60 repeat domain-containing protein [Solirubrobacter deserti]